MRLMKRNKCFKALSLSCLVLVFFSPGLTADPGASSEEYLLDEMYIRESKQAVREDSNWRKPENIVVVLSGPARTLDPETRKKLKTAAGDARLHLFNNVSEARAELERTDVLLGYCTMVDESMTNIRWVQHFSAGVEKCEGNSRLKQGDITLTNMKGVYGASIAEHVIAMMFSLSRSLPAFQQAQSEGKWDRSIGSRHPMIELKDKTMLVVGLGGIGSEIAWRANALGMRVMATRNSSRTGPDFVEYVGLASELNELASKADVVVNATPLTKSTTDLFDREFFSVLKPSAYFINIGRGRSVVTNALVEALKSKQLAGAALDVTEPEPLPAGHPLWQMDNVIITPHTSASSDRVMNRFWVFVNENLRRYVNGEALYNIVNIDSGY